MSAAQPEPTRPPFDPRRVRGGDSPDRAAGLFTGRDASIISVSQLTRMVKGALEAALPTTLHVVGELSNVSRPSGGHIYFTLKDASSEVRCVMWRSDARTLKFDLQDGMEIIATGGIDVYEPRGQYQLYVRRLEPRGVGALELAFQQLKEKLGKEGLFDPKRKRPLPRFPTRIAIVTSPTGAAIRDVLRTIERRYPKVHVFVCGVRVQGDGAAADIADAIRRINRERESLGGIDVMIVGRGGGSLEDLWAFNEEIVARAICSSEIPVVSAVGHEIDFTIADFVADLRAATPTAAAELVVPVLGELLAEIDARRHRLWQAARRRIEAARSRLAVAQRSPWFRDPLGQVRRLAQRIDEMVGRLRYSAVRRIHARRSALDSLALRLVHVRPAVQLARRRERLGRVEHRLRWAQRNFNLGFERRMRRAEARLASASPENRIETHRRVLEQLLIRLRAVCVHAIGAKVAALESLATRLSASSHEQVLRRGFTLTRLARANKVVRSSKDVREGDRIITRTADGDFASRVTDDRQGELFE